MFGEINAIRVLATKYSKPQLARMVQMGELEPQKAVMAGMMIDRIAKSAMAPPQTTVAQDVLGAQPAPGQMPAQMAQAPQGLPQMPAMAAHGGLMGMMPHSDGVAALPSGIHDMAGGGIVAFADGGDVDDIPGYAGGSLTDSRNDPAMRIDAKEQKRRDMEWRLPILLQELKEAQSKGRDDDVASIQREIRAIKPAPTADSGLTSLIPSAQAAEKPIAGKPSAPATKAAAPMNDYYQDPLGAPDYTTEGYSFKQPVEKGKTYEPSLQGLMFGYEQVEPRKELPPIAAPKKNMAPNPLNVPRDTQAAPAAPTEEKAPMGPQRPSMMDRVMGNLRGATAEEPKEKSLQDVMGEQEAADKAYGVDTQKMFDQIRQDYKESGGDLKNRADKAAGMALMMFGAGIIGARKGQEWETASKVGQQSLMTYMGAMDKINDNEDKLKQRMQDLSIAENQYKRTRSDKALAEVQANRREIQAVKLENAKLENQALIKSAEFTVDLIKNQNPAMYQTLENIAIEQRAKGNKNYTTLDALRDYQGVAKTGEVSEAKARQEWASNPLVQGKFPNADDYVRFITGTTKPAAGSSKVKFLGYEGQ